MGMSRSPRGTRARLEGLDFLLDVVKDVDPGGGREFGGHLVDGVVDLSAPHHSRRTSVAVS